MGAVKQIRDDCRNPAHDIGSDRGAGSLAKAVRFRIHLGSRARKDLWRSRFGEEDQEFC